MSHSLTNAMTVDVEDYFHVSAFDDVIPRRDWNELESRVSRNTERLLEILEEAGTRATFFVLGWVGERFPRLVNRIAERGHEVASHGYDHRLVYRQTPSEFRNDVRRARDVLETATGVKVEGYRAPSYSVTTESLWALDVLMEEGYRYDASIFPIWHDRYGIPGSPRHAYEVRRNHKALIEVPGSTVRLGPVNLPVSGGGYFRILPYAWTRWGIERVNRLEGEPVVFYTHPWEIDPAQPRFRVNWMRRFRHYHNLQQTESRLRVLLSEFTFAPLGEVLRRVGSGRASKPSAPGLPGETWRARV